MARYSLVHMTCPTCPPPEFIRIAAQVGYDCVSLRTIPTRLAGAVANRGTAAMQATTNGIEPYDIAHDRQLLLATRRASREYGIPVNDTENARIFDGCDVANYEADLEAAAELGAGHILTNIWSADKGFRLEQFCKLAELAAGYGLTVNIEFVTWAGVKDLADARELLCEARVPNGGVAVDALHFHRSRVKLEELDACPPEWFRYTHLSDIYAEIPTDLDTLLLNGRDERWYPGEGAVDLKGLVAKLPQAVRGLEVPSVSRVAAVGAEAHARTCLEKARGCFRD